MNTLSLVATVVAESSLTIDLHQWACPAVVEASLALMAVVVVVHPIAVDSIDVTDAE